jgi:hypothetical protein
MEPMTPVITLVVLLFGAMWTLAFLLASYALPFMLGLAAYRLVLACGTGWIVAGVAAIVASVLSFVIFVYLRAMLRNPLANLALCVAYAVPSAVAGYALMHGILRDAPEGILNPGRRTEQRVEPSLTLLRVPSRRTMCMLGQRNRTGDDNDSGPIIRVLHIHKRSRSQDGRTQAFQTSSMRHWRRCALKLPNCARTLRQPITVNFRQCRSKGSRRFLCRKPTSSPC